MKRLFKGLLVVALLIQHTYYINGEVRMDFVLNGQQHVGVSMDDFDEMLYDTIDDEWDSMVVYDEREGSAAK